MKPEVINVGSDEFGMLYSTFAPLKSPHFAPEEHACEPATAHQTDSWDSNERVPQRYFQAMPGSLQDGQAK